jgi:hypothetical protein
VERGDLMGIPHQNLVLEHNSNDQHKSSIVEEFEGTTVASPNNI